MIEQVLSLIDRGGPVMWPLLLISLLALAMCFERAWFWVNVNGARQQRRAHQLARLLREGDRREALRIASDDGGVYSRIVVHLLTHGADESAAAEAVSMQRPRMDRFMAILSTFITAAPMLGILGTVIGIISSFEVLSVQQQAVSDPTEVSKGIAEALLTTAFGLLMAIFVLAPFNIFRVQGDRCLDRIEWLIAASQSKHGSSKPEPQRTDDAGSD